MRKRALLLSLLSFIFSLISTIFVLLAVTSSRWSVQKYYLNTEGANGLGSDWHKPICVAHKSPFYRCDPPILNLTVTPPTCEIPNCNFYQPSGWNETSCRLAVETNGTVGGLIAGEAECQEVHYTGNLQIASSVFLTLSLLLLLPLTAANIASSLSSSSPPHPTTTTTTTHESKTASSQPIENGAPKTKGMKQKLSPVTPYLSTTVVGFLLIGAGLQVLAQFFGVLGLSLNATPTAFQAVQNERDNLGATPWIIDKALSTYASIAWLSALLAAVGVRAVYRRVRWEKVV